MTINIFNNIHMTVITWAYFLVVLIIIGGLIYGRIAEGWSPLPYSKFRLALLFKNFRRKRAINLHRGFHYIIDVFEKSSEGFNQEYVRVVLFKKSSDADYLFLTNILSPHRPFTVGQLTQLLTSPNLTYAQNGQISAESNGEKIYYEQLASGENITDSLLDLLCDFGIAYPRIVSMEGEAIPYLRPIIVDKDNALQLIAIQLLRDIAAKTVARLGKYDVSKLLCRRCIVHFAENMVKISLTEVVTFFGCRSCNQSKDLIEWGDDREIVGILDSNMAEEISWYDDKVQVNWLNYRRLFDFDKVELRRATDEDVERFAVQIGNDTDEERSSNYKNLHCTLSVSCNLSTNTLRILQKTFGNVELIN